MADALVAPASARRSVELGRVVWLDERLARAAYARFAAEHGGPAARMTPVLLAAALGWPRTVAAFSDRPPSMATLAAAYATAIVRMRPFREGNQAMACLLSMLFLRINGVELPTPPLEKYFMFAALADGRADSAALARWMRVRHLANQRGVGAVLAVRIRDGHVRGFATGKEGDASASSVAIRPRHLSQNPRHPTP